MINMRGPLYSISYDGKTVRLFSASTRRKWGIDVNSMGNEPGVQSFAFHPPQFNQQGTPGCGKSTTLTDTATPCRGGLHAARRHQQDDMSCSRTARTPGASVRGAPHGIQIR
jgi:hypothetical protein